MRSSPTWVNRRSAATGRSRTRSPRRPRWRGSPRRSTGTWSERATAARTWPRWRDGSPTASSTSRRSRRRRQRRSPTPELEEELLALPGVGPYAAAHIMMMLGRHSRLVLDSWTRPKYTRLVGRKQQVSDRQIERRFRPYGEYAGLAFWLFVTRDWVEDGPG